MTIETGSKTWDVVSAAARDTIEEAQHRLEGMIDQREADFERGRLSAMRDILKLAEPVDMQKVRQLSASGDPAGY